MMSTSTMARRQKLGLAALFSFGLAITLAMEAFAEDCIRRASSGVVTCTLDGITGYADDNPRSGSNQDVRVWTGGKNDPSTPLCLAWGINGSQACSTPATTGSTKGKNCGFDVVEWQLECSNDPGPQ